MVYIFSPTSDDAKIAVVNKIVCEDYVTRKFYVRTARASAILATTRERSELKLFLVIMNV